MEIRNTRTGKTITAEAGVANTFFSRARGLMLSPPKDLILVSPYEAIETSAIHMMLMRYPIDVIWLDTGMKVVGISPNTPAFNPLKPHTWKTYKPCKAAKYVIELGKNKIPNPEDVAVGDILQFNQP